MDIINANIKFIRKQKGLTQQKFADLIGIKRSSLGAYEEGRAKPSYATIQAIAKEFSISLDKLLTENLAAIADRSVFGAASEHAIAEKKPISSANVPSSAAPDVEGKKLRVLSITVDSDNNENIELVPQKARAGYLEGMSDPDYIESLPKFKLPFLPTGTYRAFEIKGDSMIPLQEGSIVVGEYIENWKNIKSNDTYVIVSKNEGIVYKRVMNNIKDTKSLILHSDNTSYPPYRIKVTEVMEVWKAKAYISKELPNNKVTLEKLMSTVMDLQQEVIKLKGNIAEA